MSEAHKGTGDELWDEFVRELEKGAGVHEPSAAERAAAGPRPPGPARQRRRGAVAVAVALGVVAAVVGAGLWMGGWHRAPGTPQAGSSARPTATATTDGAAKAASGPAGETGGRSGEEASAALPMVSADQAFPAHVGGFTRVKKSGGPNCTGSGMVGPSLTSLIRRSKGCRGVVGALYKDAEGNQYTMVAFAMRDPGDTAHLVTALSARPTDYEVGVLLPPTGSGLRPLPADSGLVQSFAGTGKVLVVGLAQWSDGRSKDFDELSGKLRPLVTAVTEAVGRHDHG
ncbi:hypothetical protein ACIPRD_23615 [Streptomyces sp. NPDC090108]|uniref:hypothetical protein n=1 Tax=Streptomyces sp. NPDC090108 TaxID=3365947 RepID=UPI00382111FC